MKIYLKVGIPCRGGCLNYSLFTENSRCLEIGGASNSHKQNIYLHKIKLVDVLYIKHLGYVWIVQGLLYVCIILDLMIRIVYYRFPFHFLFLVFL